MEQNPSSSRNNVWESVQAYRIQCASCSKWRLVPLKEKYEEIRETIKEQPFRCDIAGQWKPEVSCENESDVKPKDRDWLWAMDRPNSPRTPKGWQRIIRARSQGGTKFADVYYVTPSNKRLRSMVELSWYLGEHPQLVQSGVAIPQFSFQPPVPFHDNFVEKRRPRSSSRDTSGTELAANPITAIVPSERSFSEHGELETVAESRGESSVLKMEQTTNSSANKVWESVREYTVPVCLMFKVEARPVEGEIRGNTRNNQGTAFLVANPTLSIVPYVNKD